MKQGHKLKLDRFDGAIRTLADNGKSCDYIARYTNTTQDVVRRYCRKHGIALTRPPSGQRADPARDRALCDLFKTGKTLEEVGQSFGVTRERVRQILVKNDITERYLWTIANSGQLEHVLALYEAGEPWGSIGSLMGHPANVLQVCLLKNFPAKSKKKRRIAKFWRMVAVSANQDRCWLWQGGLGPAGHGHLTWGRSHKGAHVIAYMLASGKSSPRWVLHTCDNPGCCNPKHLYEGTAQDNARDRDDRGRGAHQNGRKLCDNWLVIEEVNAIRKLLKQGIPQTKVAEITGVSFALVNQINTGKAWSNPRPVQALPTPTFKMIYEGLRRGSFSQAYISRRYGINQHTVQRIKKGDHWRVKKMLAETQEIA